MESTSITIRMDKNLKKRAELLFDDMGMNMTTAFTIFAKTVVRERKIPFEIEAPPAGPNRKTRREAVQSLVAHKGLFSNKQEILDAVKEGRK
jgi:DNA-damage-inducible protein J